MGIDPADLPDYLVEIVAREVWEKEHSAAEPWDAADPVARAGALETARMILMARAAQSDIKR